MTPFMTESPKIINWRIALTLSCVLCDEYNRRRHKKHPKGAKRCSRFTLPSCKKTESVVSEM